MEPTNNKEFYGLTKEQLDTLAEYLLNKPAREVIPFINILGSLPRITFKAEQVEVPQQDPEGVPQPVADFND